MNIDVHLIKDVRNPHPFRRLFQEYENDSFAEIIDEKFLDVEYNGSNCQEIKDNIRLYKMLDDDERFITFTTNIETFHRGYLSENFEKFILEAHQHGLLVHFFSKVYNRFGSIKEAAQTEPEVLTMHMLSAGFYVWLATVGIACVVFIGELIKRAIEK